jgi:hypothetical protein
MPRKIKRAWQHRAGDPRDAAAQIVQDFKMRATRAEIQQLTNRLENARVIGLSTVVPTHHLTQHSRWLAVVEGARAAVLSPQADEGPAS